ncbi:DNA polymerase III subunit delta [Exiguobacterium artemiae]|uniref:DNA polymerase III subunit delta n=1 Tax=Exiguobacterium artemiae TaxID=340145 RepID=UPI002964D3FE|nr:DNA polymerase III subunit delta [Exiguobacterium sibiricum]MDW2886302.1 DNA polymerase III subunit delta [Exiguobacterium sibiricum]
MKTPWLVNGKLANLYLLYGTERHLLEEWEREIVKAALPDGERFDYMKIDLNDQPLDAVLDEAETVPFLSDYRVVIAKPATFLTGAKDKKTHNVERLAEYIVQPADYAVVVLIVEAEKLDERKTIVKRLKDRAVILEAKKPTTEELFRFVMDAVNDKGYRMDRPAIERLIFLTGEMWATLTHELDKLMLYAGDHPTIELEDVNLLVPRTLEDNVFQLTDYLMKRQLEPAIRLIRDLEKQGQEVLALLGLMARQYRMMLLSKRLAEQGYGERQIASKVGAHPYAIKLALQAGKRFTFAQLEQALVAITTTDEGMKTGRGDKRILFDALIVRLATL